jgi:transposase
MLVAIWHMLTTASIYQDLGGGYFTRLDPERALRQALKKLQDLGYTANWCTVPI